MLLGTALAGFRSCKPPWLRLSQSWDHKPLRRQSYLPGRDAISAHITLLGPELDQLANDR